MKRRALPTARARGASAVGRPQGGQRPCGRGHGAGGLVHGDQALLPLAATSAAQDCDRQARPKTTGGSGPSAATTYYLLLTTYYLLLHIPKSEVLLNPHKADKTHATAVQRALRQEDSEVLVSNTAT